MVKLGHGDLPQANSEALINAVNGVNGVGAMGRGIALRFKEAVPPPIRSQDTP